MYTKEKLSADENRSFIFAITDLGGLALWS